tara:strand:- start:74 stop:370 length:297 start_codon:yes stop_codon:yes gene_type:complete
MNTKLENVRSEIFDGHRVRIDEMVEHDMDGNPSVVKNVCFVFRPNGTGLVFNVSPYAHHDAIMEMAEIWIACGCPENKDELGIPQKWDADSLHVLVTS